MTLCTRNAQDRKARQRADGSDADRDGASLSGMKLGRGTGYHITTREGMLKATGASTSKRLRWQIMCVFHFSEKSKAREARTKIHTINCDVHSYGSPHVGPRGPLTCGSSSCGTNFHGTPVALPPRMPTP